MKMHNLGKDSIEQKIKVNQVNQISLQQQWIRYNFSETNSFKKIQRQKWFQN